MFIIVLHRILPYKNADIPLLLSYIHFHFTEAICFGGDFLKYNFGTVLLGQARPHTLRGTLAAKLEHKIK